MAQIIKIDSRGNFKKSKKLLYSLSDIIKISVLEKYGKIGVQNLEKYSGGKGSLKGFNVIISHVTPSLDKGIDTRSIVRAQLRVGNTMGVNFIMLDQGEKAGF